jgi:hypothetical protein
VVDDPVPGFVTGAVTVGAPNTSPGAIGAVVRAGIIPSRFCGTDLIQLFFKQLKGVRDQCVWERC